METDKSNKVTPKIIFKYRNEQKKIKTKQSLQYLRIRNCTIINSSKIKRFETMKKITIFILDVTII